MSRPARSQRQAALVSRSKSSRMSQLELSLRRENADSNAESDALFVSDHDGASSADSFHVVDGPSGAVSSSESDANFYMDGEDDSADGGKAAASLAASGKRGGKMPAAAGAQKGKRKKKSGARTVPAGEAASTAEEEAKAESTGPLPPPPRDVYQIAPYPQDGRRTRLYAGPLKKWDRFRALVEILYGPNADSVGLIEGMRQHWIDYPVLPRRTRYRWAARRRGKEAGGGGSSKNTSMDDRDSGEGDVQTSPWLSANFEADQAEAYRSWYADFLCSSSIDMMLDPAAAGTAGSAGSAAETQTVPRQQSIALRPVDGQQYLPQPHGDLVAVLGPAARQQAVRFRAGMCQALHDSGMPAPPPPDPATEMDVEDGEGQPKPEQQQTGWLFDAGGIVVATAWAPLAGRVDQLLAVAVLPHEDQDPDHRRDKDKNGVGQTPHPSTNPPPTNPPEADNPAAANRDLGSIQLWRLSLDDGQGWPDGSRPAPMLERVCLFDWGRPKRMQWCPVPLTDKGGRPAPVYGLLAVLASDGVVRVIEVDRGSDQPEWTEYDWIDQPVATLGLPDEYNIAATCLTWIGINRLALGHSDGSISLWSVFPAMMLQRQPVHSTFVLDICSGYPSHPYMVASYPVGGLSRLIDLSRPSNEHTFHPSPLVIFQPGLLQWCDHMLGFASVGPSSNPLHNSIDFLHVRFYASSRAIFPHNHLHTQRNDAPPVCLDVGAVHPYILLGRADGSLWACNMLQKVCHNRSERTFRIKIMESEFRPVRTAPGHEDEDGGFVRGAVRFLQGFAPELNEKRAASVVAATTRREDSEMAGSDDGDDEDEEEEDDDDDDDDGNGANRANGVNGQTDASGGSNTTPGQTVLHDVRSRISAVAWNPNIEYGWWAAVGMASGLVRVMDLGIDPKK